MRRDDYLSGGRPGNLIQSGKSTLLPGNRFVLEGKVAILELQTMLEWLLADLLQII